MRRSIAVVGLAWVLGLASVSWGQEEESYPLAGFYGFQPVEITKVDPRAHSVVTGDFNRDGRQDLAIVNNAHSRIDLFLQQEKAGPAKVADKNDRSVNTVSDHWRMTLKKIALDRPVSALATGDLNADGRSDLVYFGGPDRLVILLQDEKSEWKNRQEIRLADVEGKPWCVVVGDLNHDTLQDLIVLGKRYTSVLYQRPDGTLAAPMNLRNTGGELGLAMIQDLDGDGRNDLFYTTNEKEAQLLSARLQGTDGQLGPELRFDTVQVPRGVTLYDMDGKAGSEVLVIDGQTNRVRALQVRRPVEGELGAKLIQYGIGGAGAGELVTADLDGDGLQEVVTSNPDLASVVVFHQRAKSGLDLGVDSPSFLGVTQLQAVDLDGDSKAEVIVFSPKENSLGISRFEQGKLAFPESLPIEGNLKAFTVADIDHDGKPEIIAVTEVSGRGTERKVTLSFGVRDAAGLWSFATPDRPAMEIKVPGTPDRVSLTDVNMDGRADYIFYVGGKPPQVFVADEKGMPKNAAAGVAMTDVGSGAVNACKLEEPTLLVSQGNFVRSIRLDESGRWQVVEQFNADDSAAKIVGSAVLDLDGKPGDDLVMIDTGAAKLRVYHNEAGEFQPWKSVDLGGFPYKSSAVADLNGDGRADLLLNGGTKFAVLYAGQSDPELKEIATYESPRRDVFLMDLVAGDVNHDGRPEVCVLDTTAHLVEIVAYHPERGLQAGLNFKVFEEKSFQGPGRGGIQPREAVIAEVTGDGLPDLVLLCHDRILVYPQDGPIADQPVAKPLGPDK